MSKLPDYRGKVLEAFLLFNGIILFVKFMGWSDVSYWYKFGLDLLIVFISDTSIKRIFLKKGNGIRLER